MRRISAALALLLLACGGDDASAPGDGGASDASIDAIVGDAIAGDAFADASAGDAGSRGPAYDAGTAGCPAQDGTRRIKLVNNCTEARWFKLDGRTTPAFARPTTCAWAGAACTDNEGVGQCTQIAKAMSSVDPGNVYCKAGACACNPYYEIAPGKAVELALPAGAAFPSGTAWLATGCNALGAACTLGDQAAKNSVFEWTYDAPGGSLYYDVSAVNAWTTASAVGMKSCGGARNPNDKFHCTGTGCRFDVRAQCPDGTASFAGAPNGCITCPIKTVNGKQVIDGSCGPCPNGASSNRVPTGTTFNANNVGGTEWTWQGAPDFATAFGFDEGVHASRRFTCTGGTCTSGGNANTCLGGCDLCTVTKNVPPDDPACIKYCCPDVTKSYAGASYRYDSAGCTALGVQRGTDYTATLKAACPYVYTYGYEDHSSTFICEASASLLVQACPDPIDFPSSL